MKTQQSFEPDRKSYAYLEGIRGLSALYIVFFHIWQAITMGAEPGLGLRIGLGWAVGGEQAVVVFIVLSGFLLNLPLARTGELDGGLGGFWRRRAWRILPAYWVVLGMSAIFVTRIAPSLFADPRMYAHHMRPEHPSWSLLTHLCLIHNFFADSHLAFNGPLWTIATEWQLYIVFSMLLVPLRSRYGPGVAFLVGGGLAIALCTAPGDMIPEFTGLGLIGFFALGGLAAEIAEGPYRMQLTRWPWLAISVTAAIGLAIWLFSVASGRGDGRNGNVGAGTYSALAVATMILAVRRGGAWTNRFKQVLERKAIARLGAVSYSLYLTHSPLLAAADAALKGDNWSPPARAALLVSIGVPACLALATLLYLTVERSLFVRRPANIASRTFSTSQARKSKQT